MRSLHAIAPILSKQRFAEMILVIGVSDDEKYVSGLTIKFCPSDIPAAHRPISGLPNLRRCSSVPLLAAASIQNCWFFGVVLVADDVAKRGHVNSHEAVMFLVLISGQTFAVGIDL